MDKTDFADFQRNGEGQRIVQKPSCDSCNEVLAFAMEMERPSKRFSIGLYTVLECLKIAEVEGYLPRLPEEWWTEVAGVY